MRGTGKEMEGKRNNEGRREHARERERERKGG